ncbi:bifunctional diguanylate cyclase/phosphodiesterase [Varunaivibrio sulfuroxidans]|uniref:PAS domain S-box-containing protein/diguanylate cyclase (GGDEF)-like protein n=1 Tax=Varunaivibrio sulfuroxidans TaxID=1773489 RepID=A0A4R3J9S8_9PROT|nr:EAL domain-containing protein [Varunaivibrio sulfuroxidans]TCS61776.1 PAS domain S-box-containing protein/diguanylate cyclase (GGDEF)-like protein [Varunaivibrio sulfuroxidans]WES32041.1 EAL domain-containing protein [Varunaivibrio sulfuroxidans]
MTLKRPLKLRARVLLPLAGILITLLSFTSIEILYQQSRFLKAESKRNLFLLDGYYTHALENSTKVLKANVGWVARDPEVIAALEARDKGRLTAIAKRIFANLPREFDIMHFRFLDPSGDVLAYPGGALDVGVDAAKGDDHGLVGQALRTATSVGGVALGASDTLTLWHVTPIFNGKILVGAVEIGQEIGAVITDMAAVLRLKLAVTVRKAYLDRARWEAGMKALGRAGAWAENSKAVMVVRTADWPDDRRFFPLLAKVDGQIRSENIGSRRYLVRNITVKDFQGRPIGSLSGAYEYSAHHTDFVDLIGGVAIVGAAIGSLLLLSFYYFLGRTEKALSKAQSQAMEEVENRANLQRKHIVAMKRERARLRDAQRAAQIGNWDMDGRSGELWWSDSVYKIFGIEDTEEAITLRRFLGLIHSDDRARFELAITDIGRGGRGERGERGVRAGGGFDESHRIVRPDGEERIVQWRGRVVHDEDGGVGRLRGTVMDVTEERRAEALTERLGRILKHSWNEIYVFSVDTLKFLDVSEGAQSNLGYTQEELHEMTPLDLKKDMTREEFELLLSPLVRGKREMVGFEGRHYRKDGSFYPVELRVHSSFAEIPPVYMAIVQDISERKSHVDELEHLALHDPLTDLPNRSLLQDRLNQAIRIARRRDGQLKVLVMNIDRMQEVNDTLGHENGDALIAELAHRLRATMREVDTIARLGGGEFAMIVADGVQDDLENIMARIRGVLEHPVTLGNATLDISLCIGVSQYPDHGDAPEPLLQHADIAMRMAKKDGLEVKVYRAEEDPFSLRRFMLLSELRSALAANEFVLHYQPKANMSDGVIDSVEALIRWNNPREGWIMPDEFIGLAEQTGMIGELTHWVLKEAVTQAKAWADDGAPTRVAVNLSARNLLDDGLPDYIMGLVRRAGIAPEWIDLEVTESAIMSHPELSRDMLLRLSAMGFSIAIDDFGTGYSSLAYLKALPADALKIDMSFVRNMAHNADDATIVRSTIDLAHNLGLKTIAEGVEDRAVWDLLLAYGCDKVQGYFIAKPMGSGEMQAFIRKK